MCEVKVISGLSLKDLWGRPSQGHGIWTGRLGYSGCHCELWTPPKLVPLYLSIPLHLFILRNTTGTPYGTFSAIIVHIIVGTGLVWYGSSSEFDKNRFFDKTGCLDQNLSQLWAAPHWPTRHRDQLVTDYRSPHTRSAAFVLPGFRSLDKNLIFQVLVLLGHVLLCLYSSQGCTFLWVSSWSWLGIRTWISYCRSRQASLKVKSVLFTILKLNLIPDAFYWLLDPLGIDRTVGFSSSFFFFPSPPLAFSSNCSSDNFPTLIILQGRPGL